MIKSFLVAVLFYLTVGFYSITSVSADGKSISMAAYKNKTVLIALVDAANPDLTFLNNIERMTNKGLNVIIQPLNDLSARSSDQGDKAIPKNLGTNIQVLKSVAFSSRDKGKSDLIYWLTNVEQNGHFQVDAVTANTVFVVSKEGELKSVLAGGFPDKALTDVLQ